MAVSIPADAQSAGQSFRDCGDCPEMISIPAGSFVMGVPPEEVARERVPEKYRGRSQPQHQVTFDRGFAIGKFDVTRGEFAAFVRDAEYQTGDECNVVAEDSRGNETFIDRSGYSWKKPGFSQTRRHPVVCVSWNDAKAYTVWLSRKTGRAYRLPSEAEWEYAARAGTQSARFWGDDRKQACQFANVADSALVHRFHLRPDADHSFDCNDGRVYTSPVGSFKANAFGLYDVLGNVWQWTEDCWNENYKNAPADGSAWLAGSCDQRVVRGASWDIIPAVVRTGARYKDVIDFRVVYNGFRVARSE